MKCPRCNFTTIKAGKIDIFPAINISGEVGKIDVYYCKKCNWRGRK